MIINGENPYLNMMDPNPSAPVSAKNQVGQNENKPLKRPHDASPRERKSFYVRTIHVDKILTIASNEGVTIADVLDKALLQYIEGYESIHGQVKPLPRKKIESRRN